MKDIIPEARPFPFQEFLSFLDRKEILKKASEIGKKLGISIYIVGGPVRDFFLKKQVVDLDLVVEGEAELMAQALAQALSGKIKARSPFLTYKIAFPGGELDLVTARKEYYPSPAALPEVSPGTILEDLSRRDFTINAMAVALTGPWEGKLLDPFEGLLDLQRLKIRVLHEKSFEDDPTRIFRAARYAVRFGFGLHIDTLKALGRTVRHGALLLLSPARLRGEIKRILAEEKPERVFSCLESLGIFLFMNLPEPPPTFREALSLCRGEFSEKILLKSVILALGRARVEHTMRWGLAEKEAQNFKKEWDDLSQILPELFSAARPSERYRRLKKVSPVVLIAMAMVEKRFLPYFQEFLESQKIRPGLTGEDLKVLGIPPGPLMREVLEALLYARLDREIQTEEEERALVGRLLKRC